MTDRKKTFFRENTKSEIKKKTFVDFEEVGEIPMIASLEPHEYTVIPDNLPKGHESARKFMKHGQEVKIKRFYSLEQALNDRRTPVQLRDYAFNNLKHNNFCSYSLMPFLVGDQRKRKIPLRECLQGAWIFAYAHQVTGPIKYKAYADSRRVKAEGAESVFQVPSRTEGKERYEIKFSSLPYVDSPEKYAIAHSIFTDHSCKSKRFSIRFRRMEDKESSKVFNFCAHDIAAYLQYIQGESEENKNIIPLQMSQFAIPTQETVDFYLRLRNNVLVEDKSIKAKDKLRKLNDANEEIALWDFVKALGHDKTFYARASRDGNVQDYNWSIN